MKASNNWKTNGDEKMNKRNAGFKTNGAEQMKNTTLNGKNEAQGKMSRGRKVGLVIAIVAVVCWVGLKVMSKTSGITVKSGAGYPQLKLMLEKEAAKQVERNQSLSKDGASLIYRNIDFSTKRLLNKVGEIVDELTTIGNCTTVVKLMIKDKISDTATCNDHLSKQLKESFISPLFSIQNDAKFDFNRVVYELEKSNTLYSVKLCQVIKQVGPVNSQALDIRQIQSQVINTSNRVKEIAEKSAYSAGGLVLAGIIEVGTHSTTRVFGKIVAKFVAKSAAISWLPFADGPLPIADLIWAGIETAFIAWDGYDLYQARVVLRRELSASLRVEIIKYGETLKKEYDSKVKAVVKSFDATQQALEIK